MIWMKDGRNHVEIWVEMHVLICGDTSNCLWRKLGSASKWICWDSREQGQMAAVVEGGAWLCRRCFWRHLSCCEGSDFWQLQEAVPHPSAVVYSRHKPSKWWNPMIQVLGSGLAKSAVKLWSEITFKYFYVSDCAGRGWEVNRKAPPFGFRLLLIKSNYFQTMICTATKPAEVTLVGCFCVAAMWSCKKIRQHLTSLIP